MLWTLDSVYVYVKFREKIPKEHLYILYSHKSKKNNAMANKKTPKRQRTVHKTWHTKVKNDYLESYSGLNQVFFQLFLREKSSEFK